MVEWARSASSVKISISLSCIFKCISCGNPGMTGTCGTGDMYRRVMSLALDDEAMGYELFG